VWYYTFEKYSFIKLPLIDGHNDTSLAFVIQMYRIYVIGNWISLTSIYLFQTFSEKRNVNKIHFTVFALGLSCKHTLIFIKLRSKLRVLWHKESSIPDNKFYTNTNRTNGSECKEKCPLHIVSLKNGPGVNRGVENSPLATPRDW
jgi:hypothetical protein